MARTVKLECNFCGKEIETVSAKIYLAPTLPGKTMTSFQSAYTHYGDACDDCMVKMQEKMMRRTARSNNGKITKLHTKSKSKKRASG